MKTFFYHFGKNISLWGWLFISMWSVTHLQAQTHPQRKDIRYTPKKQRLGTLPLHSQHEVIFTVTNHHDRPAIIKSVESDCGCTVTSFDDRPIAPQESRQIKATFHANTAGKFQKTILLSIFGIEKPFKLRLKGRVNSD